MRNYHAQSRRYVAETTHPDVFITLRKNRLRVYRGEEIFLNSGDEFELEFDNTTRTTWLAKIKLNGEWVSEAGLVLRPGEHVWLDTPNLDSNNKHRFRFETYNVEKGRSHLTEDNGLVEVFFYKKAQPTPNWLQPSITWTYHGTSDPWYYTCNNTGGMNINIGSSGNTAKNYPDNSITAYCCSSDVSLTSGHQFDNAPKRSAQMEETGRIEEGSHSNQDFVNSHEQFESWYDHSVTYRILPLSKQPKTIHEVKEYCSNCGRRRRKNENFCPSCGTKF